MKKILRCFLLLLLSQEVAAAVEPGKTYRIVPDANTSKSLMVADASLANKAPVVVWTETDVPAQQWKVEDAGNGMVYLRNIYTDKYLDAGNIAVAQRTEPSAWTLEIVDNDTNEYLVKQNKYLRVVSTTDGRHPVVGNGQQTWHFVEVKPQSHFDASARQRMVDGFLRHYMQDRGNGYRTFLNGGWGEAETMEALLDCYEATGDRALLDIFESCYDYLCYHVGTTWDGSTTVGGYNWFGYDFNDDVMWLIIAAARAYHLTGRQIYLNDAKRNFDRIWNRAYLGYVGLLRWAEHTGDRNGANSCINGPAEVAACYIAAGLGDETYYEKARELYANQRQYLFVPTTGQVYDSVVFDPTTSTVTSRNTWASTYNQGTMLGAAVLLYRHYGNEQYLQDADRIVDYARKNLCNKDGIISVCQDADGDFQGFKGILMRYAGLYAREFLHADCQEWLIRNAFHAYNNINSQGFGHSAWLTKANEDLTFGNVNYGASSSAFGASTALTAACAVPLEKELGDGQTWKQTLPASSAEQTGNNEMVFHYEAEQTGHYKIVAYYRADEKRTIYLTTNQGEAVLTNFPASSAMNQIPQYVTLVKGNNQIQLSCSAGLPAIEKLEVMYLAAVPNVLEAEYGKTRGQASIATDGDASGGRYVRDIGNGSNNLLTLKVDVAEAGDYDLDVTYFTGQNRQMYVRVNGGTRMNSTYASTGSWQASTVEVKTLNISLKAGTNTIAFGNDNALAPYIDKVSLKPHGESSWVGSINVDNNMDGDAWYSLSGMRMSRPIALGIYVNGGRKYLVR